MARWSIMAGTVDQLMKKARPLVVEPLHDRRRDRRLPERQAGETVQNVDRRPANDRSATGLDTTIVEVEAAIASYEQRKARKAVGLPAERGVELRGGIQSGLARLNHPQ